MGEARRLEGNGSTAEGLRGGELRAAMESTHEAALGADQRVPVLKTYKLYIDGSFPRTESGRYYQCKSADGSLLANMCLASRKDFRNCVTAARKAFEGWSSRSAYLRGQILYRMAEVLEGRRSQFIDEICTLGATKPEAEQEVNASVDRLVYYAGWSDKYQQIFSSVNPVSSSHFNFSMPEPMGIIGIIAPQASSLLGLISLMAPAVVGGNVCVVLASQSKPLSSITFSEVAHSADVPSGVINILTGFCSELLEHFASHMDVNALMYCGSDVPESASVEKLCAKNVKRRINTHTANWLAEAAQDPYLIMECQEIKTTWHPIGK